MEKIYIIRYEHGIAGSQFFTSEKQAEEVMRRLPNYGYFYHWIDELDEYKEEK